MKRLDAQLAAVLEALQAPPAPRPRGLVDQLSPEEREVLTAVLDGVTIPGRIARVVGRLQDRVEGKLP